MKRKPKREGRPGSAWLAIADRFQELVGERIMELQTLAGKQRKVMDWSGEMLLKGALGRGKYTAAQLRQIMSDVAHALSDDPKTGNPRLRSKA